MPNYTRNDLKIKMMTLNFKSLVEMIISMYRGGQERATTVFVNTVEALSWFEVVSVVVLVKTDAIMNAEMQESLKEKKERLHSI